MTEPRLTIELVPSTAWWSNVRSNVSRKDWEKCKEYVRTRSGGKCEICGGVGTKHPIECHEVWLYEYDLLDFRGYQTLVDLIALCPDCHRVKHIGRTSEVGGVHALDRAIRHLCAVNQWTPEEAEAYIKEAFERWRENSREMWVLNVDFLGLLGIEVPETLDREEGVRDD